MKCDGWNKGRGGAVGIVDMTGCHWNPTAFTYFLQAVSLIEVESVRLPHGSPFPMTLEHDGDLDVHGGNDSSVDLLACDEEDDDAEFDPDLDEEFAETQDVHP